MRGQSKRPETTVNRRVVIGACFERAMRSEFVHQFAQEDTVLQGRSERVVTRGRYGDVRKGLDPCSDGASSC